jgi:hypothetical protein
MTGAKGRSVPSRHDSDSVLTRAGRSDILVAHATGQEDFMSTSNGSFLERFIRVLTRGSIPIDASQCDGPCVVQSPAAASQSQQDREDNRQEPHRWVNLR